MPGFAATPLESSRVEEDGTLDLHFMCPLCQDESGVKGIDPQRWQAWRNGLTGDIGTVFPELSLDDHEILKTGIHPECWEAAFAEEE